MISVRSLLVLCAALSLGGCTFFFDLQDSAQPDPAPDSRQQQAIFGQIYKTMQSMKQAAQPEVSDVGPNEAQSGPERWTACARANFEGDLRYFTFFLKGGAVTNYRPAVINDRCEGRSYGLIDHQ